MYLFSRDRSKVRKGRAYHCCTSGFDEDKGLAGRYTFNLAGRSYTANIMDAETKEIVQTVHARSAKTALHHARVEVMRNGGVLVNELKL